MNIFKKAVRNLTLKYLVIIMALSVSFSVALFQVGSHEIGGGLARQQDRFIQQFAPRPNDDLNDIRTTEIETAQKKLRTNLILFNLLVLGLGSLASYFLAKETLEPIEEAVESQNRFTADASHELRTPLTAMKTEIEVALRSRKLSSSEARDLLKSNLEEINRLEELSSGLLALARIPDQKIADSFKSVNIRNLTVSAIEQLEPLASAKKIKLQQDIDKKLTVLGDEISLKRLLVILIDNAIKFSPEKSTITLSAVPSHKFMQIMVTDQGVGINQTDLPHIFERFYRADQSRSKLKTNGYGLGLAIAKSITDFHRGEITATSHVGEGSSFIIRLPLPKPQTR